jgi:hypothetical protein
MRETEDTGRILMGKLEKLPLGSPRRGSEINNY